MNNIDKALLRKGRLSALYEFKALSEIKSQELLIDLGKNNFKVTHPMTLAEIFYATQAEFEYERKPDPIGFETKMALN